MAGGRRAVKVNLLRLDSLKLVIEDNKGLVEKVSLIAGVGYELGYIAETVRCCRGCS